MMPLGTRGRYAARIMVCLARHKGGTPVTKHAIAASEDISASYAEQILLRLRTARLVRSHRGRRGGFSLARPANRVTLADVLHAVEGPVCVAPCVLGSCTRETACPTRPVWRRATRAMERVFAGTTIAGMAAPARKRAPGRAP